MTVLAQAQNNHRGDELVEAVSGSEGHLYWRSSRLYTPSATMLGDTAAGSATITGAGRDDGAPLPEGEVAVGDAVAVIERQDRWVSPDAAVIVARDLSAGTITLAGSSGMRTQARRRLDLFARPGPPDELLP